MARAKATASSDTWPVYQMLFSDHLESQNRAPLTIRTYGIAVDRCGDFLSRHGLPRQPGKVTREHLVQWMLEMQRSPADGGLGLSAQTALQRFRSLSRFFAWLVETEEISSSPMEKMKPPRVPEKLVPVVSAADLDRLFKACSGAGFEERRDKAILSLFIDVGIRIAEMAAVRVGDVDVLEREVVVLGKGRQPRQLRFVKETRADIQRYLLKRAAHPHADLEALWIGKRGQLTPNGIYQMVQRRCAEAGIEPIHPHMFRHTFAHMYLLNGGNEGDLMRVTGWKSRQMLDRYGASAASSRAADAHERVSPRNSLR